jgi:hypothetical protein
MTTLKEKRRRKTQDDIPFDANAGAFKLRHACRYAGGVSEITLRRAIKNGDLEVCRQLRHLLITRVALDKWLAAK